MSELLMIQYCAANIMAARRGRHHDYYGAYMQDLMHTDAPEWDGVKWEAMSNHTRPAWARTH